MAINSSFINAGAPVKSSIPLAGRKFGEGLGFKAQSGSGYSDDKEILVELSKSAKLRTSGAQSSKSSSGSSLSSSPLTQAINALSDVADKIGELQDKYSKAASGSELSNNLASELNSLAKEFKRITDSNIFRTGSQSSSGENGLGLTDSGVKAVLDSGNQSRIDALNKGLSGLLSFSLDDILTDRNISEGIKDFIATIKSALTPEQEAEQKNSADQSENKLVSIAIPKASIQTVGDAEGLSVSLLSYSNEDLIKAAAAHANIDSTNVLILTFNAPEPETEEEKKKREDKEQQLLIENPGSKHSTAAPENQDKQNPDV